MEKEIVQEIIFLGSNRAPAMNGRGLYLFTSVPALTLPFQDRYVVERLYVQSKIMIVVYLCSVGGIADASFFLFYLSHIIVLFKI